MSKRNGILPNGLLILALLGCGGPVPNSPPDTGAPLVDSGVSSNLDAGPPPPPEERVHLAGTVTRRVGTQYHTIPAVWSGALPRVLLDESSGALESMRLLPSGALETVGWLGPITTKTYWVWTVQRGTVTRAELPLGPFDPGTAGTMDLIRFAHDGSAWRAVGHVAWRWRDAISAIYWDGTTWFVYPEGGENGREIQAVAIATHDGHGYVALRALDGASLLWVDGQTIVELPGTGRIVITDVHVDASGVYVLGSDDEGAVYWSGDGATFTRHDLGISTSSLAISGDRARVTVRDGRVYIALTTWDGVRNRPLIWHEPLDGSEPPTTELLEILMCGGVSGLEVTDAHLYAFGHSSNSAPGGGCSGSAAWWIDGATQRPVVESGDGSVRLQALLVAAGGT